MKPLSTFVNLNMIEPSDVDAVVATMVNSCPSLTDKAIVEHLESRTCIELGIPPMIPESICFRLDDSDSDPDYRFSAYVDTEDAKMAADRGLVEHDREPAVYPHVVMSADAFDLVIDALANRGSVLAWVPGENGVAAMVDRTLAVIPKEGDELRQPRSTAVATREAVCTAVCGLGIQMPKGGASA